MTTNKQPKNKFLLEAAKKKKVDTQNQTVSWDHHTLGDIAFEKTIWCDFKILALQSISVLQRWINISKPHKKFKKKSKAGYQKELVRCFCLFVCLFVLSSSLAV